MLELIGEPMNKGIVLAAILLVFSSPYLFSETFDCQQSFDLGKIDAKEEHKVWGWYLFGLASGLLAYGTTFLLDSGGDVNAASDALFSVISIAPLVPALLLPRRNKIAPYSGRIDLECYRDGYKRRATLKNCGAVLFGVLTSHAVVFVVGRLYFVFYYSSAL